MYRSVLYILLTQELIWYIHDIWPKGFTYTHSTIHPLSLTKRIQGHWQTHGHYSVAFQSRNFMQDISLHYHKWQVSTHLPIWKNWLHHFMLNRIKRLRWMSIVLLQKMKSLIERCFASQRSLNLQFVESLILFKENLQQTSATKAGF